MFLAKFEFKRRFILFCFFLIISIFDHLIWILVKVLPNKTLINLLEKRHFRKYELTYPKSKIKTIVNYILKVLQIRVRSKYLFSSCLSISIISQFIFDLLSIENTLFLGMHKNNGKKIPHAWISISFYDNEQLIISNVKAVILKSI